MQEGTSTKTNALRERGTAVRESGDGSAGQADRSLAPLSERVSPPTRSLEQRQVALKKANRIRSRRADLKRQLRAKRVGLLTLMDDGDCATMKVIDALLAMPKVGRVKAHRALVNARISPSKTLSGLTERQRGELLGQLPGGETFRAAPAAAVAAVAPIHSVPRPTLRGRRARGTDDLLADIKRAGR